MTNLSQRFRLGTRSRRELDGVHPDVVRVVEMAIQVTDQDFGVYDGIRAAHEQNALFQRGASQKDGFRDIGKHQIQADGYGHAVDLVPWINGNFVWDWPAIYVIADAVVLSARTLDVPLRWGGCWGPTPVNEMAGSPEHWVQAYVKRKRAQGRRAFNDGPHWELMRLAA